MASTPKQRSDHISMVRAQVRALLEAVNELAALRSEWDALGMSSALQDTDMIGENEGLLAVDIANVYTSATAINNLLAAGHATNLYKAK